MKKRNEIPAGILLLTAVLIFTGCEKYDDIDNPGTLLPRTADEDPMLPRIELNGATFHAETFGDIRNPVLVFLHGGPGKDYRALISQAGVEDASRYPAERNVTNGGLSQLQDQFYCVFYDQRGTGLSQRFGKGEVSFNLYLDDLKCIIDFYLQLKREKTGIMASGVYLFGWSFGGMLATGFINEYPGMVKGAVLYEPGPLSGEVREYMKDRAAPASTAGNWLDRHLLSRDQFITDDHFIADCHFAMNVSNADDVPFWRPGAVVRCQDLDFMESEAFDITSNLSAFTGTLLYIGSEEVTALLPDYPVMQIQYFPRCNLVTLAGTGHTGPWEKSGEVASLIRNFFR